MTIALPTEPSKPTVSVLQRPILVFGFPKVGKTTLVAGLEAEHTLFLAAEPGQNALKTMRQQVQSWEQFLEILEELKTNREHYPYKVLAIDTVDVLARMCVDYVVKALSGGRSGFVHASDFEWGKGWDAISEEFRLRLSQLCALDIGVVFISHVKESTVKTRTGAELTKLAPDVGQKGMRKWLLGFVEYTFYCSIIETKTGQQRVIQTAPSETVEAGGRVPEGLDLPAMIPLRADELKAWLTAAAA